MSFFTELRRRNVFKVGAAYAIVAWLLIQVADVLLPAFGAPEWVLPVFSTLLILGFPVAVLLAWAYEMTPEGIKAAADVPRDSITSATGQRLNYVILGLVVLAVGFLIVDQYVLESRVGAVGTGSVTPLLPSADSGLTSPTPTSSSGQVLRFITTLGDTEPLTDTGLSAHVALSPDGGALVYAAQSEGTTLLYYRTLDQLQARPLFGTDGGEEPFFSPDGEWVGFFTDSTDAELKKISVRGGPPQALAPAVTSAGGSWVTDDTIVYGTQAADGVRSLFRIPANGGTPEILVIPEPETGHVRPEVLPGGDAVLFAIRPGTSGTGNARDGGIAVLSLETGEYRTIVNGGYEPKYASTGHIVFARSDALWAVPFDIERLETTGPEVPVVTGVQQDGFRGGAAYSFSDAGMLVYLPGGDTAINALDLKRLVWVDRDGREELLAAEPRLYEYPRLSPDGRQLAVAIFDGGNRDIWIYDLVRDTLSRLTFDPADDFRPIFTPDGERVVFGSSRDGHGLFWRAVDGTGQVERLTTEPDPAWPESFSRDATQLVFAKMTQGINDIDIDVHLLSLNDERTSQPLLQSEFVEGLGAISPDGNWLAYNSRETGRHEVYVRPFPNVDEGKVQVSTDGGQEARWGPGGNELFYRSPEGVMAVSVEAAAGFSVGGPAVLFQDTYAEFMNPPSYDVSSDRHQFLMLKAEVSTEPSSDQAQLVVVYNWFEELNRLAPPSE